MNARGRLTRVLVSITLLAAVGATVAGAVPPRAGTAGEYLVFYTEGGREAALRAVAAAGGTVAGREDRLGYLIVRTTAPERIGADRSVVGVTPDLSIGRVARAATPGPGGPAWTPRERRETGADPLAHLQWDMKMIGATATGSYAKARGSRKVLVGVIDTGVDGKHPDIAPNFNAQLSRNFVIDQPTDPNGKPLDGPCEHKGCKDPADVDDDGHGTHVAGTIGAPLNGIGMSGVAPDVSLVNLRAGTDSGLFFLKPVMDALTYAADVGIDVVNMSFYVDPWAFNCPNNPQDSIVERLEQRGVIEGMRRALAYARSHGVTLISAIGNGGGDLGKPVLDATSPDYPKGAERSRKIDNSCLSVPAELPGVISVSSVGPSGRKAPYSDYGIEQTDIAAPGGDIFDGSSPLTAPQREILAPVPEHVLRAEGLLDKDGRPKNASVVRDCQGGRCAYYRYLEGTSMAAPHVTGVAAIIISRFGKPGKGGLYMDPAQVERLLYASAVPRACPTPRAYKYGAAVHVCEGDQARNGFYGHGVVNALRAAELAP